MSTTAGVFEPAGTSASWWSDAVCYRVDLPRFARPAADRGSGPGGITGLIEHLGYVELIGVAALVVRGVPVVDAGADGVRLRDRDLGDVVEFDRLVAAAHAQGLRLVVTVEGPVDPVAAARFWLGRGIDGVALGAAARPRATEVAAVVADFADRVLLTDGPAGLRTPLGSRLGRERTVLDGVPLDAAAARPELDAVGRDAAEQEHTPVAALRPRPAGRAGNRARLLLALALPGMIVLDAGVELGLQDPEYPHFPWQPPAPDSAEAQLEDAESTLSLTRAALDLRGPEGLFRGARIGWYGAPPGCLAFRRGRDGGVCVLNASAEPVPSPPGRIVVASATPDAWGRLPALSAAWLQPDPTTGRVDR